MRRLVLLDLGGVEQQRNCEVRKMSQSWGRAVALCEWMKLLWGGDIVWWIGWFLGIVYGLDSSLYTSG